MSRTVYSNRRDPLLVLSLAMALTSCGPEDYQKPIQQFQEASAVVIDATREFLNNENTIEQNKQLDDVVFRRQKLNLPAIDQIQLITPQEIKIRLDSLDILSQYTSNLAQLAQAKEAAAVGDNTKKLSDSLKTLAGDAAKLPQTKSAFLNNGNFSGVASAAASAIGAVAQLVVEQKARDEIEQSIVKNDAAITSLIQLISNDAQGSYLRQKDQLGVYGVQLSRDYELELRGHPDPILLLELAKTIKTYRMQMSALPAANPAPAIDRMKKAHEALVAFAKSDKSPKTLSELVTAVEDFVKAAQPLGQAVQALIRAS